MGCARSARRASSAARTSARIAMHLANLLQVGINTSVAVSFTYVPADMALAGEGDQPVAAPAGYPMPPEGYPFPFVYPPYGYMPPPADGQQHPEGAPNGAPPMPHPVYPPYPTMYPHPYGAYPGAPPMGYPPMMGAPVATSPNPSAKPDSSGPAPVGGSVSAEPSKSKKRSRAKGEEGSRSHKKHKEARADEGQPGGEALPKDPPQPSPFVGHPEGGPAATFNGPEPRPLMATM